MSADAPGTTPASAPPSAFQAPRGVPDYLPPTSATFLAVRDTLSQAARLAGYSHVELPVFEDTALYARGVGESTDVVSKEMYSFADRGGRSVTLRPEGTAGVARSVIEHGLDRGGLPVKLRYAGPFFLKHILDALDNTRGEPGREAHAIAFVYAIAAFACSLLKIQADLQHLYFGRRAGTRVRTELMVAIYDKALKRKDFSSVTKKEDGRNNASNAGSGQVLNLMSADVTLVSNTVSAVYMVYRSKLELYQAYSGPDQYSSAI